ncbi:uncharacterized protein TNCT_533061 [Trichonephila clavata]|uniref:DNA-directed DNA polymerase n=1 Tax=Trichonephila clavata TaxID=2740835 RepID=A0A8X6GSY1_TRICU|nr:uncharacterized protein TNCT_533061 [Trichonephila clavata]
MPHGKKRKPDNSAHALNVFTITTFDSMTDNELDFLKFFDYVRLFIFEELQLKFEEKKTIKWYAVVQATLTRTTQENDAECITPHFRSNCVVELMGNTIAEHLESAFKKIQNSFEEFTQRGSGWTLENFLKLELNMAKYQPLSPSNYIPLPKKLADKKAILNIKNEDQKCLEGNGRLAWEACLKMSQQPLELFISIDMHLFIEKGLKLTKVHKVLSFKQKPWLKPYNEFNTNQTKLASSSFEKDFFKLLNDSVYGKTMENVRKHSNVQLVTSEKQAKKLVAAPTFKRFKIITESLVALEKLKSCITHNRPIYIGFVILELSKVLMYNFHYNHIKKRYMDKANTDSLTYEIETEDIYKDTRENLDIYDTSDYPQDHALYSEKNKKRIGCFKDEMNSKPIIEFVGLRAKMYSMLTPDSEKKTAKGVSKVVHSKKKLKHSNYLQCLKENKSTKENMILIKSENHDIYTVRQNKTALSSFDDKRYILDDNIGTFAYGYYKINENPI